MLIDLYFPFNEDQLMCEILVLSQDGSIALYLCKIHCNPHELSQLIEGSHSQLAI